MSMLHRHGAASSEVVTSISTSESQRTREENDSTERATHTRRRFLLSLMGAGGLVAVGGVGALVWPRGSTPDSEGATAVQSAAAPNFLDKLTINTIKMPETTNPKTFAQVFANVGQAIQYEVNHGQADKIPNLIPGGRWGVLQPGQFQLRADWLHNYHTTSLGTVMDRPDDPLDPRYYAWGFSIEMLKQLTGKGNHPQDPHTLNVSALVRVTIGDLPPLTTQARRPLDSIVEPHTVIETNMLLTRVKGMAGSNYVYVDDVNGKEGHGWAIAGVDKMQELPDIMASNLPPQFTNVPPLFAQ